MTKLLEQAVKTARGLPPDVQDDVARLVLHFLGCADDVTELTPDEEAAVLRSREAAARGDFASAEDIRALWAKHGL